MGAADGAQPGVQGRVEAEDVSAAGGFAGVGEGGWRRPERGGPVGRCGSCLGLLLPRKSAPCSIPHKAAMTVSITAPDKRTAPLPPPGPLRIDNPKYKGKWVAPDIDNPEYKADDKLHVAKDTKYVGFELWQVKAGTIFDNIIVTDDLAAAKKLAEATWKKNKDGEKAMWEKIKKVGGGARGSWRGKGRVGWVRQPRPRRGAPCLQAAHFWLCCSVPLSPSWLWLWHPP